MVKLFRDNFPPPEVNIKKYLDSHLRNSYYAFHSCNWINLMSGHEAFGNKDKTSYQEVFYLFVEKLPSNTERGQFVSNQSIFSGSTSQEGVFVRRGISLPLEDMYPENKALLKKIQTILDERTATLKELARASG